MELLLYIAFTIVCFALYLFYSKNKKKDIEIFDKPEEIKESKRKRIGSPRK